ncbi:MAG: heparinase II/III-family protein [Verrucomicrobia bacterium]|nr:heparinase II/III-family protein [Verrucomicrobiota bacterium]
MRSRPKLPVLVALLLAAGTIPGPAGEPRRETRYETYTGFTLPPTPVLPAHERHPSLWFSAEAEIAALRQMRDADDYSRRLWQQIASDPVVCNPLPTLPESGSRKFQTYYATLSRAAKLNGLMSVLADEDQRQHFRARAVAALKRAYDGPVYEHTADKKNPEGIEDIHRATIAQNYCEAYDWVQPLLNKEDDTVIRRRLIREAETIYDNLYVWVNRPHNHLSKPAWALGTFALTLSSHPQAGDWLARALKASNQNTRYFFSADGIYREGPHYLMFSAINFIPFLYHYRNVAGVDCFPAFQPAFEAVVATRNGKGWLPNIYDSYIRPFPTHMVASPYLSSPTWLNPGSRLGNVLQWNFLNTDFEPFEKALADRGRDYTGATLTFTLAANEFLTYDPAIRPVAPSVSPTVFMAGGQTVFRNGWSFDDPAQRYLLFQGVAGADNHFHHDHLSFVIQAENQMMASDAGYSRGDYHDDARKDWYMTPAAHNLVTADGNAPVDPGENITPVSRDDLDTAFFAFQEKEAPYPNRATQKRAIAFVAGDYFVVIDQLTASQPAEYRLHLHGGRGAMKSDGNRRVWTYTNDLYGPAAQMAAWVLADGAQLEDKQGELTYIKGDYATFGYVSAGLRASNTTFLQVIVPLAASAPLPRVTDWSDKSAIAATLEKDGALDTFVARRVEGGVEAAKLATDARFAWMRSQAGVTQWAIQQGTALTHDGVELVKSSVPVTMAGRMTGSQMEAVINTSRTNYVLSFPAEGSACPPMATFNDKPIAARSREGRLLFDLNGRGRLNVRTPSRE